MIRFGEFAWDPQAELLTRGGVPIPLQPKTALLLAVLVSNPGQLWTREELDREVWPGVSVTEDSLSQVVRRLRTALGDDRHHPRFLETVQRRGYRWIGAVSRDGEVEPARRATLVRPDGPLFGRIQERAQLGQWMGRTRLVTLVGPGGVGKTRLALALPSVVACCRLGAVGDEPGLLAAMVVGLGLSHEGDREAAIRAALAASEGWVLLDEAEGVVELVVAAVGRWLGSSEGVRLLVTSRVRLGLAAEHCLEVGPLTVDEGAALYRARSLAVEPSASDADPDVHSLVARLDGFPLAIELAAARRAVLSPAAVGERLGKSLAVLATPRSDRPPRHRSMADALAWSWSLLGPTEQRAAVLLSAFVGGMSLPAAERVLADLGDPLELLESLRHRSWLLRDGERLEQYTLVRAWLVEQREAMGLGREARLRHAAAMAPFFAGHQFESTVVLAVERENLWAALRATEDPEQGIAMCRALVRIERSPPHEPLLDAIDRVIRLADGQPVLQAHAGMLRSLVSRGRSAAEGLADAERSVALAGADPRARGWALVGLAPCLPAGDPDTIVALEEAVELARAVDEPRAEVEGLAILGYILIQRGRWIDAGRATAAAVARLAPLSARWSQARLQVIHARFSMFLWDHDVAHHHALEALEVLDPQHDPWLYARGLLALAEVAAREGRLADADSLLDQVDALGPSAVRFSPHESPRSRVRFAVAAGELDRARALLAAAPPPPEGDALRRSEDQMGIWSLLIAERRWTELADQLGPHAEVFRQTGHRVGEAEAHMLCAVSAAICGDGHAASRWADLATGLIDAQMGPQGQLLARWADVSLLIPPVVAGDASARPPLEAAIHALARWGPPGPTTGRPTIDTTSRILATALSEAVGVPLGRW